MVLPELSEDWRAWLSQAQVLSAVVAAQDWERAIVLAEQLVAEQATLSPLAAVSGEARDKVLAELIRTQSLLQSLTQQVTASKNQLQPELALLKTRQNLLSAYKDSF